MTHGWSPRAARAAHAQLAVCLGACRRSLGLGRLSQTRALVARDVDGFVFKGGPRLPCGFPLKPEKRSPNKHVTHTNERANHLARVLPRLFPHVIVNPEIGTWDPEPLSIFIEAAKVPESQRHLARHKASISRN